MCTYTITVDEKAISQLQPQYSREALGKLLQRYVDALVEEMTVQSDVQSPNAHTVDEMKAIVMERLSLMESGEATYIDGDTGFAQIRERYGL